MTSTERSSTAWYANSSDPDSAVYLPMLATPWPVAFDDENWWFEVKWDGYRCVATAEAGRTSLRSRRGLDMGLRFPAIAALDLPAGWVLDGEVVALDEDGRSDFSLLQAGGAPTLVVFDVLATPDGPVISQPIEFRWDLLAACPLPSRVVTNPRVRGDGRIFSDAVEARGLEGIVAKRSGSIYQPGRRSRDWRKVAFRHRMRAVVGGWLPGEGGRSGSFGSLLVGLWDGSGLRWVGAVGSGFTDSILTEVRRALEAIERGTPPFYDTSLIPRGARWVEPGVVVEVEYKEWTRDHHLRAPVFKGVSDIDPATVTWADEGPS